MPNPFQQTTDSQLADHLDRIQGKLESGLEQQVLAEVAWRLRHPSAGAVVTDCVSGGDIIVSAHDRRR